MGILGISRWALFLLLAAFAAAAVSGLMLGFVGGEIAQAVHYWAGRVLPTATLIVFGIWAVTIIERAVALRRISVILRVLVPLFALLVTDSTSFTGYLGPSRNPDLDSETRLRFMLIHCAIGPFIVAALLGWWWLSSRRLAKLSLPGDSVGKE